MPQRIPLIVILLSIFLTGQSCVQTGSREARDLLEEAAVAMGGMDAVRALRSQVIVSEGKQYEPEQALRPGGHTRTVAEFRYRLLRDLTGPRVRLEWSGQRLYPRQGPVNYLEIIDGEVGLLEENSEQTRMHPARAASRLREEYRVPAKLLVTALETTDLERLPDVRLQGRSHQVLRFWEKGQQFVVYIDPQTKLPSQVVFLEDDPIYGDSRYALRYSDWREIDGLKVPFTLSYEINGRELQSEQYLSVIHNADLPPETFSIPKAIEEQEAEGEAIPSQWVLRRLAMNVSYTFFGRPQVVELVGLGEGVIHARGSGHRSVIIEMEDHLVVVEAPLYEERSEAVLEALGNRFPAKPVRYVIPTHFHNDHTGGIRRYIAEGATILAPSVSADHYRHIASAPHNIQPDQLQTHPREMTIEVVEGRKVLEDGRQRVEIYPYPTAHADDYQIIYLPREKLLVEADHVSPRPEGIRPGELPSQILEAIAQLNLDVETIVGIHGEVGSIEELRAALQTESQ